MKRRRLVLEQDEATRNYRLQNDDGLEIVGMTVEDVLREAMGQGGIHRHYEVGNTYEASQVLDTLMGAK